MSSMLWGIPITVQETVVLEEGDLIPDGAEGTWRVVQLGENDVLVRHRTDGREQRFPREIDLRDEAPGYVIRMNSTPLGPIAKGAVFGQEKYARLRATLTERHRRLP